MTSKNTNRFGLIAAFIAVMLFNLVSACAPEVQEDTFNPSDFVVSEEPNDQGLATYGVGSCESNYVDRDVYYVDDLTGEKQTCSEACTSDGCISFGEFGLVLQALELDGSINPQADCSGNCAPLGISICGYATLDGVPYMKRWLCLAWIDADGVCHMKAVPNECNNGKVCENSGIYPNYGVCEVPQECTEDSECDDANQCTADTCVDGFCQSDLLDGEACDDSNACTDGDVCNSFGDCIVGDEVDCDDGNACTTEYCDPALGCVIADVADGEVCDDFNPCTDIDVCTAGVCAGTDLDCNDANECTTDSCDVALGCVNTPVPNDGIVCDDTRVCTSEDICMDGECNGTEKDCDDSNPCTADSCDPLTADCLNVPLLDGEACDGGICVDSNCTLDDNWCTDQDGPECRTADGNTEYWVCTLVQDSTYGVWELDEDCGPVGGAMICAEGEGCIQPAACLDNSDCLDDDVCNGDETCLDGACVTGADLVCDDADVCTTDSCDATLGCQEAPIADCCVDDVDCVEGEVCPDGVCVPEPCVPQCEGLVCGDDGCDGNCGAGCEVGFVCSDDQTECLCVEDIDCADGEVCTDGVCIIEPECTVDADCPEGQFCGSSFCYEVVDQKGNTGNNQSGADGGPWPDGTNDFWDDDGDCYCEVLPCYGSAGDCENLFGGDCDDGPTGAENHPGAADFGNDKLDNNCDGLIVCATDAQCLPTESCVDAICTPNL